MSICKMTKILIVSHRSEATELLEALQGEGICQILSAEKSAISKNFSDLTIAGDRPKEIEDAVNKINSSINFLKRHARADQELVSAFAPRVVIDPDFYKKVITDESLVKIIDDCIKSDAKLESLKAKGEQLTATGKLLAPWVGLNTALEDLDNMTNATSWTGFIANHHFSSFCINVAEAGGVVEQVGEEASNTACVVVCLNDYASEVNKVLRATDFENVNFAGMSGLVRDLLAENNEKLTEVLRQQKEEQKKASELANKLLEVKTLSDYYENLLDREQTRSQVSSTEQTVLMEGWIKEKNLKRLEKVLAGFKSSIFEKIEPTADEEIPVEIENNNTIRPFEVITRLYGMPRYFEVDPTIFLAPFFALFFGLCLTDAGYGILMVIGSFWLVTKMQGDKKLLWMLVICSVFTIAAGALTGGWFGDSVQQLNIGWLNNLRTKMMWFDPLEEPMMFFGLALALGYFQIMVGFLIALVHNLIKKDYIAAICDQLTWLVMLNSIVIFGMAAAGVIDPKTWSVFGKIALVPAVMIFLFSHREGGMGARLGMGTYNLFSSIFIVGDVLSYLRLMALGMVTAGLGMAINVIAKIALEVPFIGFILMGLVLLGGHSFNIAISGLSAFVHTLRLQYVEFFPKFIGGGGRLFEPLSKEYKYVYIK